MISRSRSRICASLISKAIHHALEPSGQLHKLSLSETYEDVRCSMEYFATTSDPAVHDLWFTTTVIGY